MQNFFNNVIKFVGGRRQVLATSVMVGSLFLSACGGGSASSSNDNTSTPSSPSSTPSTPPPVVSRQDAVRFLEQSSFGPTPSEIARVQSMGISAYIDDQLKQPATGYTGFSYAPPKPAANCTRSSTDPTSAASLCARDTYSLFQVRRQFFMNALSGSDQLRQRVAYALSQIMVVSGKVVYKAYGMADYQNILLNDAFGNYRKLLMDVTLSPVMGRYLDMVNNSKATATSSPNENYAREVMQLFSIGVNKLNLDGTLQKDAQGNPIPTYDQNVIKGYAALFTGWTYPPLNGATSTWPNPQNYDGAMVLNADHHDTNAKLILNNVTLPAGQTGDEDLKAGIDAIFNDPNVGPFICKRLIQHLVTSNPSPAYVARVATVFNDNGQGVRGDLSAVIKAILLDPEARGDNVTNASFGYLRDPALFITTLLRNLGGQSDGVYASYQAAAMGEPIFTSPSVFNFFPPDYHIAVNHLEGPEFGILSAPTVVDRANFVYQLVYDGGAPADPSVTGSIGTFINLSGFASEANDANTLVEALNQRMMHGRLSSAAQAIIVNAVNSIDPANLTARVQMAVYLISTSQQYQVVQ